jgi:hypothetical protein
MPCRSGHTGRQGFNFQNTMKKPTPTANRNSKPATLDPQAAAVGFLQTNRLAFHHHQPAPSAAEDLVVGYPSQQRLGGGVEEDGG